MLCNNFWGGGPKMRRRKRIKENKAKRRLRERLENYTRFLANHEAIKKITFLLQKIYEPKKVRIYDKDPTPGFLRERFYWDEVIGHMHHLLRGYFKGKVTLYQLLHPDLYRRIVDPAVIKKGKQYRCDILNSKRLEGRDINDNLFDNQDYRIELNSTMKWIAVCLIVAVVILIII